MKRQESIQQILILVNVGETEHLGLRNIKKKELKILYNSIFNFAHSRQNNWINVIAGLPSKEIS